MTKTLYQSGSWNTRSLVFTTHPLRSNIVWMATIGQYTLPASQERTSSWVRSPCWMVFSSVNFRMSVPSGSVW